MVELAFSGLGAHRVSGHLDPAQPGFGGTAGAAGMRREALLVENEWVKGEWTDEVIYAVLAREWLARSSP